MEDEGEGEWHSNFSSPVRVGASTKWQESDKATALRGVRANGHVLHELSNRLREDREVVLAAVRNSGLALMHAAEAIRDDREVYSLPQH